MKPITDQRKRGTSRRLARRTAAVACVTAAFTALATTADAGELEDSLAALLAEDRAVTGDARLAAALTVAAYRTVLVASVRRILAGETAPQIVDHHVARLHTAFDALDTAYAIL
jgi:hypothetical protein